MRPVIFRGKLSHSNEWIEGNLIIAKNGQPYIIPFEVFEPDGHHLTIDSDNPFWVDPETVGQYTGINDKYNIGIFSGDICRVTYYNHSHPDTNIIQEVIFERGLFVLKANINKILGIDLDESRLYVPLYYSEAPNKIEVIGNITDNKHLLNND